MSKDTTNYLQEIQDLPFLSNKNIRSIERIGGGNNNRVFKLLLDSNQLLTLKYYFRHPQDPRNRLKTEFQSLGFLWSKGVRCIAQPVSIDEVNHCAFYSYIEGQQGQSAIISSEDINQVIQFIDQLNKLSTISEAKVLGSASEATFSLKDLISIVVKRLTHLKSIQAQQEKKELSQFIIQLDNFSIEVIDWSNNLIRERGFSDDAELANDKRVLSPSDFGFHNAIKSPAKLWHFIDFEYFGWDDPAKLICDFILHPGMNLTLDLQKYFITEILKVTKDQSLHSRLREVYPLYGIKWALIMLNEFIPEFLLRRGYANLVQEDLICRQMNQLTKSAKLIDNIKSSYRDFNSFFGIGT